MTTPIIDPDGASPGRRSGPQSGTADPGHRLASSTLDYLSNKRSDEAMNRNWDRAFAEPAGTRLTG
jgi:hypothetical protein